jgi:hypothetical protein
MTNKEDNRSMRFNSSIMMPTSAKYMRKVRNAQMFSAIFELIFGVLMLASMFSQTSLIPFLIDIAGALLCLYLDKVAKEEEKTASHPYEKKTDVQVTFKDREMIVDYLDAGIVFFINVDSIKVVNFNVNQDTGNGSILFQNCMINYYDARGENGACKAISVLLKSEEGKKLLDMLKEVKAE